MFNKMESMMTIEQAANTAIFHLQLNTRSAVRYVVSETNCTSKEAERAINETVRAR